MRTRTIKRPIIGGTLDGIRPMLYHYWRTGYGTPYNLQLDFWVSSAGEYHCKADYRLSHTTTETNTTYQMFLHLEGKATITIGDKTTALRPGNLFVIKPDTPFVYHAPYQMKYHWISMDGRWPDISLPLNHCIPLDYDADVEQKFVDLRETLIVRQTGFPLEAIGLVYSLLARLHFLTRSPAVADASYPELVLKTITYLRENYAEPFDAAATAEVVGVSPSYLRSLFRRWVGQSPQQFHTHYRIDQAKRLLNQQPVSIFEVAYHVGFSDPRYFARIFKQVTGQTPSQYAKNEPTNI